MCARHAGLAPGLSHYSSPSGETGRQKTGDDGALWEWNINASSLGLASQGHLLAFHCWKTAWRLRQLKLREISTLSSHKLNLGSHDSLLRDLATHCYLQGTREGKGRTQGRGGRVACETEEFFSAIYLLLFISDMAVIHGALCYEVCLCVCVCVWVGVCVCVCVCVWRKRLVCWSVLCESSPSCWRTDTINRSNQCCMKARGKTVLEVPLFLPTVLHTHTHSHTHVQ